MTLLLMLLTTATAWALNPLTEGNYTFSVGTDDEGEYYVVDGTEALDALATYVNAGNTASGMRFKQTADITYAHSTDWNDDSSTENNFTAIGYFNSGPDFRYFCGTFDGGGHTVSGIRIYKGGSDSTTDSYQGLFGVVYRGTVKNVTLADIRITGYHFTGGVVGYNDVGTVSNCRVESNVCIHSVQGNAENHGGVVGYNYVGTVCDCFSAATVSTNCHYIGAIVGYHSSGTLLRNTYVYTTCKGVGTGFYTSADVEGTSAIRETVSITYIGADGTEQTTDATKLIGGYDDNIAAGTYAVVGDLTYSYTIHITGDVHLILADGYTMTVSEGININEGTLNIYGQQGGSGTLTVDGKLGEELTGNNGNDGDNGINGNIIINGGIINITGGGGAAGKSSSVFSSEYGNGGNGGYGINGSLTVNCGTVTVRGGNGGKAGSHSGLFGTTYGKAGSAGHAISGTVTFDAAAVYMQESDDESTWSNLTSGSTSTKRYIRTGEPFTMSDDEYTIWNATGWNLFCDLIEGGESFSGKTVKLGDDITVTRMAGSNDKPFNGTFDGQGHTLTLNYGSADNPVDAQFVAPFVMTYWNTAPTFRNLNISGHIYDAYTGSEAHNVGGLIGHLYGTVTIEHCTSNVSITSTGGAGGFVGLCEHTVSFTDCMSSAVIHSAGGNNSGFVGWSRASGHAINFDGCLFNGKLLQIDGNGSSNGGFIGWTGSNKTVTITNSLVAPAALADGETMASSNSATFARGWNATTTATNSYYTQPLGTAQGLGYSLDTAPTNIGTAGTTYSVSGITPYTRGLHYGGHYYMAPEAISLSDTETNDVAAIDGYFADVTLSGRTLCKDNSWNTLCLPFSLDAAQVAAQLAPDALMTLESTKFNNGTLTLNFEDVTEIEAGKPYIIKWFGDGSDNIVSPVFNSVIVESGTTNVTTDWMDFVGVFSPTEIYEDDDAKHNLYLGIDNTLYYPTSEGFELNAFRAYFQLKNGQQNVLAFILNFGDGEATGVRLTPNASLDGEEWYDLSGRRLSGKPTQRGIYINNGNKTVIK